MLSFESHIPSLGVTSPIERAATDTELHRLATYYQENLSWFGDDGKATTRGLSNSVKQNFEALKAAQKLIKPILASAELDESIYPIPFISAIDAVATANTALEEAIRLYTGAVEQIGCGQIPTHTPIHLLTMELLALIHQRTGALPRLSIHNKWIDGVLLDITGKEVTTAWLQKQTTQYRNQIARQ